MNRHVPDLESAIKAHREGRFAEAYSGYVRLLTSQPHNAVARHHLGVLELHRGNPVEAARQLETVAAMQPENPAVQADLGRALLGSGQLERAADAFMTVAGLTGDHPDTRFHLGLVRERQGRFDEAEAEFRQTLELQPDHGGACLRLGYLAGRRGDRDLAQSQFEEVIRLAPDNWEALLALAALDEESGNREGAEARLRTVIALENLPVPDGHVRLSRLLEAAGREDEAIEIARQTTGRFPEHDIAWRQLGQALKRQGRLDEAVEAFARAHALLRSPGSQYGMNRPEIRHTHRAKLRHDIDQLKYLKRRGIEVSGLDRLIVEHEALQASLPDSLGEGDVVGLPPASIIRAGSHYNRCLHRAEAPALESGSLNPHLDPDAITKDYFARQPGITWIDGFLRPEALESLRHYLLESTIWHDAEHPNGYVGAYIHDGFDCPLILQIARDLPALLPDIFGDRPLLQLWAYHYDSQLSGIDMHADFAAVNVNFWLTPDDALLDPDSGGMRIWDVEAPAEWGPEDFNTAEPETKQRIDDYLASRGARELVVPHRQNRVVIFNSDLFHRTDDIRFRDGFENRRINVTMLYGRREQG
ncbi:MAG: tetratricopeptide repeat protein [Gammaproteobacteria bacterium]|jgi:tetratricopeptide (TPR) repeat protein